MSSKEICPRFYICSLISSEHEKHGLSPSLRPSSRFALLLPSLARYAAPASFLSSFSPLFHSSSSHLDGNPISNRQSHYPRALVDVCADIGLSLPLAAPVRSLCSFSPLFVVFSSRWEYNLQFPVPSSTGPRLCCRWPARRSRKLLGWRLSLPLYLPSHIQLSVGSLGQTEVESTGLQLRKGPDNGAKEYCILSRGGPSVFALTAFWISTQRQLLPGDLLADRRKEACEAANRSEGKDTGRLEEYYLPPRFHTFAVEGALSEGRYK
jgi:hypothetical protein